MARTGPDAVHAPHGPLPRGGTVRPITRWGAEVMHRPQQPVSSAQFGTEDLRALAADLVATMYAADGVGLAACQVGEDVAMFVFDCPDEAGERYVGVVCNPTVTVPDAPGRSLDDGDEGCLSFPGAFCPCPRPAFASVDGFGVDGEPVHFEGDGLLARCLQHETDHTVGTVFGDRISTRNRKKLTKAHDAAADDYPPEWPT